MSPWSSLGGSSHKFGPFIDLCGHVAAVIEAHF